MSYDDTSRDHDFSPSQPDDMILTNKQEPFDDFARRVQADMQVILDDWMESWLINVQPVLDGQVTVEVGAVPE